MVILFDVLARLPLSVLHRIGALFGWVAYLFSKRYSFRLRENLEKAGLARSESELKNLLHTNIREMGKAVLELPWVWRRPFEKVVASVVRVHGWEYFETAQAQNKGVILLTPHIVKDASDLTMVTDEQRAKFGVSAKDVKPVDVQKEITGK